MSLISASEFQKRLAALPLATYQAGQTVFAPGSKTGLLLILKNGAVAIIKEAVEIAKVVERGSVFGEMSALLGEPHTAEVRAVENSQFHVADAAMVMQDPISLHYIAILLARRLEVTNEALYELKSQLKDGHPAEAVSKTLREIEELLNAGGATPPGKRRFFIKR
jgi:CRP/FNR family transcriptional regulator, cyclic AMP receptor protein